MPQEFEAIPYQPKTAVGPALFVCVGLPTSPYSPQPPNPKRTTLCTVAQTTVEPASFNPVSYPIQ